MIETMEMIHLSWTQGCTPQIVERASQKSFCIGPCDKLPRKKVNISLKPYQTIPSTTSFWTGASLLVSGRLDVFFWMSWNTYHLKTSHCLWSHLHHLKSFLCIFSASLIKQHTTHGSPMVKPKQIFVLIEIPNLDKHHIIWPNSLYFTNLDFDEIAGISLPKRYLLGYTIWPDIRGGNCIYKNSMQLRFS